MVADFDGSGSLDITELQDLCLELVIAAHQKEQATLQIMQSEGKNIDRLKRLFQRMFDPKLAMLKDPVKKPEFLSKVSLPRTLHLPRSSQLAAAPPCTRTPLTRSFVADGRGCNLDVRQRPQRVDRQERVHGGVGGLGGTCARHPRENG